MVREFCTYTYESWKELILSVSMILLECLYFSLFKKVDKKEKVCFYIALYQVR